MGTFIAPSITTTLTSAGWRTELNNNFANVDTAFAALETLWGTIDLTRLANFTGLLTRRLSVEVQNAGAISAGVQTFGIIVPFQGIVDRAYARVATAPADDAYIDLEVGAGATWNSILSSPILIPSATTTPCYALAGTDNLLDVGDYVRINVLEGSGGIASMANLQVSLLMIPRDWDIYA